ncbi:MAG: nucleotidyltransferase family protein [Anaerolineae bacterium]|nr:nucleotidyltransferase family protein [Anaerolineae bacterium]
MARARVNTLEDLIAKRAELTEICRRNDISYLGVFGSFAHNEVTFTSDVDLLVHFSKDKSLLDLVGIENEFTEVLRRKVDLLTEDAISPYLKDRVLAEVKVIYEKAG